MRRVDPLADTTTASVCSHRRDGPLRTPQPLATIRFVTLLDEVVQTDYGQFDLVWAAAPGGFDGNFDRFFAGQVNGLVGAADPGGLYLHFARRSGGSRVRIELLSQEPQLHDEDPWEDLVEVSVTVPEGSAPNWFSWGDEDSGELALPSGTYRVRVSAEGRDLGADNEFADEVVDTYLLEFWPAPYRPDEILKVGSVDAQYWHQEVGSRR